MRHMLSVSRANLLKVNIKNGLSPNYTSSNQTRRKKNLKNLSFEGNDILGLSSKASV